MIVIGRCSMSPSAPPPSRVKKFWSLFFGRGKGAVLLLCFLVHFQRREVLTMILYIACRPIVSSFRDGTRHCGDCTCTVCCVIFPAQHQFSTSDHASSVRHPNPASIKFMFGPQLLYRYDTVSLEPGLSCASRIPTDGLHGAGINTRREYR
ncbi:hypothetical protein HOY82DRAFT_225908 [Tuber indicum]|nr:hypothetical protein HOY82DRAFT_225908 [Tuber indicum]